MQFLKIETTTHGCVGMAHNKQYLKCPIVDKYIEK
jgi:hypothetical protein